MSVHVAASGLRLPTTNNTGAMSPFPASCSSSSQIMAAMFSPLSSKRKAYQIEHHRSPFLGAGSSMIYRSRSLEFANRESRRDRGKSLRRAVSANIDTFGDDEDEFVKKLQELVLRSNQPNKESFILDFSSSNQESVRSSTSFGNLESTSTLNPVSHMGRHPWQTNRMGPPEWADKESIAIPSSMERIANSVDLPVSLRIIKQKKKKNQLSAQWGDGFRDAGECAKSSVQKAFSSMVFMIRELHCYTLEMRQALFYEDTKGVLSRVHNEMHASFVWLFQQIFSGTPTLMVSVMLLLANFTVYSMSHSVAMAEPLPPQSTLISVLDTTYHQNTNPQFEQIPPNITSNPGRTAYVGGGGGGGGKVRPVAGSTDDGRPENAGPTSSQPVTNQAVPAPETGDLEEEVDEVATWNGIVEEAYKMQAVTKDESLSDPDILKWMIAPVMTQAETVNASDYMETEFKYQLAINQDPHNSLVLTNFAQFLQLVLQDHERAEHYYKKAAEIQPGDAEALNKYATFLWVAKNDLTRAEDMYLESIAADPGNSYYAANYAHFLWNTGGEDTCYPLDA